MNEDRQLLDSSLAEPKSFQTLPIEVIEKILDFVDFADKKSLSETCKRFAKIVGDQMSLQRRIWLKLSDESAASHLTRTYVDFNCIENSTVPSGFFGQISPTIKSLKFYHFAQRSELEYLIEAGLANFVNLTHLDLSYVHFPDSMQAAHEPVDMNHLEFLSINANTFAQLEGQFINFKTKKLHTLELRSGNSPADLSEADVIKIRTLLERQTRLRVLHLLNGSHISRYFFDIMNQPLVIPSMLHQIKMCGMIFTVDQRNNLFSLIRAQTEMTRFDVYCFKTRPTNAYTEFGFLLETLLDYPLEEQKFFDITHPERENSFPMGSHINNPSYNPGAMENIIEFNNRILQFDHPNVHTKKLLLRIGERCGGAELLNYVVSKFPETESVEIVEIYESPSSLTVIPKELSPLNSLKNLKSLKVNHIGWIKPVNIENLQHFGFHLRSQSDIAALMEFMNRHKTLESLFGNFCGIDKELKFDLGVEVLESICKNMKKVKLLTLEVFTNGRDEKMHWNDMVCATVWKYASSGFVFDFNQYFTDQIMKRYDGEIVKRVGDGRWQKVDVPLKLRLRRHKKMKI